MELNLAMLLDWKALFVPFWFALFFLAERFKPAAQERLGESVGKRAGAEGGDSAQPGGWSRVLRNLLLWLLNVGVHPLFVVPVSIAATTQHLGWRPDWWSGWSGLLIDLIILDLWIYWWHRANHELPLLWRFHEVHHLDGFLDTTTALRFHFGEVLLSALARALVIVMLDIPITSILVFETLILAAAIFHHSNLALPSRLERALSRVIITPSIHWVHHHARRGDTDSNYGTIFSFWDPLFGSRSAKQRALTMPIGVEGEAERSVLQLLWRPFSGARRGA